MAGAPPRNRRIVFTARPQGLPTLDDFRLETTPVPEPGAGQVLLRTQVPSLDPYMRSGTDAEGTDCALPMVLGSAMPGGAVIRVVASAC